MQIMLSLIRLNESFMLLLCFYSLYYIPSICLSCVCFLLSHEENNTKEEQEVEKAEYFLKEVKDFAASTKLIYTEEAESHCVTCLDYDDAWISELKVFDRKMNFFVRNFK